VNTLADEKKNVVMDNFTETGILNRKGVNTYNARSLKSILGLMLFENINRLFTKVQTVSS
jgi:hypothetical protein